MSKKGGGIPRQNNPHLKKNVSIDVTHSSVDSIPIREDQTDVIVQSLNLAPFKTKKCSLNEDVGYSSYSSTTISGAPITITLWIRRGLVSFTAKIFASIFEM
jgi:hypothetical protein